MGYSGYYWINRNKIMAAIQLLFEKPQPTNANIDNAMAGNMCICGTFQYIQKVIHLAAPNKKTIVK
jgi:isoquinoline 1-oxidoreductase alpha subunit